MLTGSTLTLRPLPVLSPQLLCRLSRNQVPFARPLALVPCSRKSAASYRPYSVLGELNGPRSHDASATNSHPAPSWRPAAIHGSFRLAHPSGMPAAPADDDTAHRLADIHSPSGTQGCQQHRHAPRIRGPHRSPNKTKRKCPSQRRRTLLWVMLTTRSPDRAWAAYEELLTHQVVIPHRLLHQLVRHLASIKPRTRTVHLRLLSVLKLLQKHHGQLRLWEWNTLIDSAGKQWHKTRLEEYENALDIFNKKGVLPIAGVHHADEALDAKVDSLATRQDPDIWTYNILLSIAARSNAPLAVRHASSLLLASGLSPNRYTHLCLLRYYAARKDLRGVRATLRKMRQQGLEVGLDGTNACLWAYARNGRFDVALRVYRILRSHVAPSALDEQPDGEGHGDMREDARYVREVVGLDLSDGLAPDAITYTTMIQTLAYHGDLRNALGVYVDMLSTPEGTGPRFKPTMAAFRALFLGFARHGRRAMEQADEHRGAEGEPATALYPSERTSWDQDTLETVFSAFMRLPKAPELTDRIMYWILVAFDKTSGSDAAKLREVWTKLETKYGGGWGGRLEEMRKSIFATEGLKA